MMSTSSESSLTSTPLRPLQEQITAVVQRLERVEKHLALSPLPDVATLQQPSVLAPSITAPVVAPASIVASAPVIAAIDVSFRTSDFETVAQQAVSADLPAPFAQAGDVIAPIATPVQTEARTTNAEAPEKPITSRSSKDKVARWSHWEGVVGGQWALWAGAASLFLALALFLAYTWTQLPPAPPWARVAMGVGGGLGLIGASQWARSRAQRGFSEGLCGAGLAMVYLSLWAGSQSLNVLPFAWAFGAMGLTTVLGTVLALRTDAQGLLVLATIGGFCTPLLLSSSGSGEANWGLLVYVALLDAGIVAASVWKRWHGAMWFSFVATVSLVGAWALSSDLSGRETGLWAFCTLYFVLFVGASVFYSLRRREATAQNDLLLLFGASSIYALSGFALLQESTRAFPATFPLGLCIFFAILGGAVRALAPDNRTLRDSASGLSILFATVAIPVQLRQSALAIGWSVEAAVLLVLAQRLRGQLLGRAGQIVWLLSLFPLLGVLSEAPRALANSQVLPFWSGRAMTLFIAIAATTIVAWQRHRAAQSQHDADTSTGPMADELATFYPLAAVLGGAWLLAQEIQVGLMPSNVMSSPTPAVFFAVAMAWSFYSVAIFAVGLRTRWLEVRAGALIIAALAWCLPLWTSIAHNSDNLTPFWNPRALSFVLVAANLAVLGALISREKSAFSQSEARTLGEAPLWVALFVLLGATTEIWFAFSHWHSPSIQAWPGAAVASIAMLWAVFSVLLIVLSNSWRQSSLRMMALPVGAMAFILVLLSSLLLGENAGTPFWNPRVWAFVVVTFALALAAAQWQRADNNNVTDENAIAVNSAQLSATISVACGILVLWGATSEIFAAAHFYRASLGQFWSQMAQLGSTMVWFGVALGWIWQGARRDFAGVRLAGYLTGTLALAWLMWTSGEATRTPWLPFFNARFVAMLWAGGAIALALQVLARARGQLKSDELALMNAMGLGVLAVLWWALTRETWESAWHFRDALGSNWERTAQMAISLVWAATAALLLSVGIARRQASWRLVALGLLALTVLKLFGFDLSYLHGVSRIFSLAGVGIALLFISWLYSRFGNENDSDSDDQSSKQMRDEASGATKN